MKNAPSLTLVNGPTFRDDVGPQEKDPADIEQRLYLEHFDVVRVDGQIKEHWDEARINPVRPPVKNRSRDEIPSSAFR